MLSIDIDNGCEILSNAKKIRRSGFFHIALCGENNRRY